VQRTYPSFEAARYWTGSAFMCATAAAVAMLRGVYDDSLLPLLAAGTIMVLATCLAAMGVRCFYDKPVAWQRTALITGNAFVGMFFFIYIHDSASARLPIFT
ncbi:GGDEF domain-containing protein, partial [Salmonella enterica subsp. enterica serovar Istanbul]|nr:GGDEF domain-containing protein [Salmonella enterica subsp. enterica serovar Istanbul]